MVCQKFTSNARLCNHYKMGCYDVVGTLRLMPREDQSIIEYTSKGYEEYAPFVIGTDFECFNIQHSTTTRKIQIHTLILYQHTNQIHMLYAYQYQANLKARLMK